VVNAVKKYAPKDFIVGYRISPEEINPNSVGYTWHESTQLIKAITDKFDLDYIYLSLPAYDQKPEDSDKTFAELFRPVLGEGTKEIIVGGVDSPQKARDAMKYTDLVAVGRENIIDPLFAEKILTGHEDEIIDKITIEQTKKNGMTQGMIDNFSAARVGNPLTGDENIKSLHTKPGAWSEMTYVDSDEMK
ncbi:MAG: NADH-dependent oxidoreductase, partial [Lactobacillus acidophilus]